MSGEMPVLEHICDLLQYKGVVLTMFYLGKAEGARMLEQSMCRLLNRETGLKQGYLAYARIKTRLVENGLIRSSADEAGAEIIHLTEKGMIWAGSIDALIRGERPQ